MANFGANLVENIFYLTKIGHSVSLLKCQASIQPSMSSSRPFASLLVSELVTLYM